MALQEPTPSLRISAQVAAGLTIPENQAGNIEAAIQCEDEVLCQLDQLDRDSLRRTALEYGLEFPKTDMDPNNYVLFCDGKNILMGHFSDVVIGYARWKYEHPDSIFFLHAVGHEVNFAAIDQIPELPTTLLMKIVAEYRAEAARAARH